MATKTYVGVLGVVIACASCGTSFAMQEDLEAHRREDHKTFYCPNGHTQYFPGKSELEKTKENLKWERDRAARLLAERDQISASLRTTKGHVTRLRNRATAGECPFGCGRRFAGLTEHIAKVHPDQHLEGE